MTTQEKPVTQADEKDDLEWVERCGAEELLDYIERKLEALGAQSGVQTVYHDMDSDYEDVAENFWLNNTLFRIRITMVGGLNLPIENKTA